MDECAVGTRLEVATNLLGLRAVRYTELDCSDGSGGRISSVIALVDVP